MKMKQIFTILVLFATITASAQDILYKTSGEQLQVKVLEVSKTDVKYKLTSNLEGPDYVLPKADVFMVEYANGSKDVFATDNKTKSDPITEASKAEMTKLEELEAQYRRRKNGGIAATVIGGIGVGITIIVFADGMIKLGNAKTVEDKDKATLQPSASGAIFALSAIAVAAGISSLVKARKIKTKLNNGEFSFEPKIINSYSFQGSQIRQNSGFGVGIAYSF